MRHETNFVVHKILLSVTKISVSMLMTRKRVVTIVRMLLGDPWRKKLTVSCKPISFESNLSSWFTCTQSAIGKYGFYAVFMDLRIRWYVRINSLRVVNFWTPSRNCRHRQCDDCVMTQRRDYIKHSCNRFTYTMIGYTVVMCCEYMFCLRIKIQLCLTQKKLDS